MAAYELEAVDVAEDGQLSIGVPGEQMPLDGLRACLTELHPGTYRIGHA